MNYVSQYTDFETFANIGEYKINFPEPPPDKSIINYGLPAEQQKIIRSKYKISGKWMYASDISKAIWNRLPEYQKDEIEKVEWDRRWNGQWYFNKGKKIFVPENQYFFLNYFDLGGYYGDWWDSQWFDFLLLKHAFDHGYGLGVFKVKGRRGGSTAVANSSTLDLATKFENVQAGMMNKNKLEAKEINFDPIVYATNKLPAFMAPVRSGNTWPTETLRFYPPSKTATHKKLREETEELDDSALHSLIDYIATSTVGYDGRKKIMLLMDEIGKWKDVSPKTAIEIQKLCCQDGAEKFGILYGFSSVEEISDEQLQGINNLWEACDPKTAQGNMVSSMNIFRYFEPFYFGLKGYMDAWGYSDAKTAIEDYKIQEANILKISGKKAAMDFRRKSPETIDHALLPSSSRCVFNAYVLDKALKHIERFDRNDPWMPVRARFRWEIPFKKAILDKNPDLALDEEDHYWPWIVSGNPLDDEKNKSLFIDGFQRPGNIGKFSMGIDPIDHDIIDTNEESKLSNAASRIKRKLDRSMEDPNSFDANGEILNYGMNYRTGRTYAHYCSRPDEAKDFFEQQTMAAVYYGTPVMLEGTAGRCKDYFIENGLIYYLLDLDGNFVTKGRKDRIGYPTSGPAKQFMFDMAEKNINELGMAERHKDINKDLLVVNKKNLTHHDLSAAYMLCEVAEEKVGKRFNDQNPYKQERKRKTKNRLLVRPGSTRATKR